jgi:hypothetical protein
MLAQAFWQAYGSGDQLVPVISWLRCLIRAEWVDCSGPVLLTFHPYGGGINNEIRVHCSFRGYRGTAPMGQSTTGQMEFEVADVKISSSKNAIQGKGGFCLAGESISRTRP